MIPKLNDSYGSADDECYYYVCVAKRAVECLREIERSRLDVPVRTEKAVLEALREIEASGWKE